VGFFDVAARLCTGDGPIAELLVGAARSFLCCDERIQVTFPCFILSDYVHMKARCVFIVSVFLCP